MGIASGCVTRSMSPPWPPRPSPRPRPARRRDRPCRSRTTSACRAHRQHRGHRHHSSPACSTPRVGGSWSRTRSGAIEVLLPVGAPVPGVGSQVRDQRAGHPGLRRPPPAGRDRRSPGRPRSGRGPGPWRTAWRGARVATRPGDRERASRHADSAPLARRAGRRRAAKVLVDGLPGSGIASTTLVVGRQASSSGSSAAPYPGRDRPAVQPRAARPAPTWASRRAAARPRLRSAAGGDGATTARDWRRSAPAMRLADVRASPA